MQKLTANFMRHAATLDANRIPGAPSPIFGIGKYQEMQLFYAVKAGQ